MIHNNQAIYSFKILSEILLNIVMFPVWWFTRGLFLIMDKEIGFLSYQQQSLGLVIWVKNIFKPMYGQSDWQGRFISFFMRLFQIIVRSIVMVFWIFFTFTQIAVWLVLPFFVIYEIMFQLGII
ncbi:MAG: hypothetical protein Q7T50_07755 [Candidatus Magasanikbacteria bacterium]|nr:hypothetical protein [Candidatus Magasanikbacteria bacterium]